MLQVASEEPVFESVVSWVKHDEACRYEYMPQLLQHVRLPLLTAKYITDTIDIEVISYCLIKTIYMKLSSEDCVIAEVTAYVSAFNQEEPGLSGSC